MHKTCFPRCSRNTPKRARAQRLCTRKTFQDVPNTSKVSRSTTPVHKMCRSNVPETIQNEPEYCACAQKIASPRCSRNTPERAEEPHLGNKIAPRCSRNARECAGVVITAPVHKEKAKMFLKHAKVARVPHLCTKIAFEMFQKQCKVSQSTAPVHKNAFQDASEMSRSTGTVHKNRFPRCPRNIPK